MGSLWPWERKQKTVGGRERAPFQALFSSAHKLPCVPLTGSCPPMRAVNGVPSWPLLGPRPPCNPGKWARGPADY